MFVRAWTRVWMCVCVSLCLSLSLCLQLCSLEAKNHQTARARDSSVHVNTRKVYVTYSTCTWELAMFKQSSKAGRHVLLLKCAWLGRASLSGDVTPSRFVCSSIVPASEQERQLLDTQNLKTNPPPKKYDEREQNNNYTHINTHNTYTHTLTHTHRGTHVGKHTHTKTLT